MKIKARVEFGIDGNPQILHDTVELTEDFLIAAIQRELENRYTNNPKVRKIKLDIDLTSLNIG